MVITSDRHRDGGVEKLVFQMSKTGATPTAAAPAAAPRPRPPVAIVMPTGGGKGTQSDPPRRDPDPPLHSTPVRGGDGRPRPRCSTA